MMFYRYHRQKFFLETINNLNLNLTNQEKQYIGSFWGFVFKNIFGYRNQKEGVTINIKGVKKFIENKSIYNDCIGKNLKILKENISISDDIIVAWGTDTINCKKEYNRIIELVENEIKDKNVYYVGRISTCGYPLHAQRWEDDMTKQVYKLI